MDRGFVVRRKPQWRAKNEGGRTIDYKSCMGAAAHM
jgi:hypothetical protein